MISSLDTSDWRSESLPTARAINFELEFEDCREKEVLLRWISSRREDVRRGIGEEGNMKRNLGFGILIMARRGRDDEMWKWFGNLARIVRERDSMNLLFR